MSLAVALKEGMKPKVDAGISFVKAGGEKTIITTLNKAAEALEGKAGTIIIQTKA